MGRSATLRHRVGLANSRRLSRVDCPYASHYLSEAQQVCDRVAILHQGRILAQDRTAGFLQQVGSTPEPTLEDVFLQLTGGVPSHGQ